MNPRNIKQVVILFAICALLVGGLTWLIDSRTKAPELLLDNTATTTAAGAQKLDGPLSPEVLQDKQSKPVTNVMNPKAVFTTNKGTFEIELFESQMPITVGNFIKLAEAGFYNGTKFHRVIDGFMIQGGDPNSKKDDTTKYGQGGPGYTIQDEFVTADNLSNVRGTIAMANTGQPNSGGSQFFINTVDNLGLNFNVPDPNDSKHPVFGKIISGMDIIDAISKVKVGAHDLPVDPIIVGVVQIKRDQKEAKKTQ